MAVFRKSALVAASLTIMASAGPTTVIQHRRAFGVGDVTIQAGESIVFDNQDVFDHQIYVESPSFTFESEEQEAGQKLTVRFPVRGTFIVQCHIHPKMRLGVAVQ